MTDQLEALQKLRVPFPANQISKLPKPTKAQTDAVKADFKSGIRCEVCGSWHHPKVVHLDYVGHAALTDRLLDVDPAWNWEPLAISPDGLPVIDTYGGMWIKLTVCGVTRLGYGHAGDKTGGDAIKEVIGDALRNSGMRFGAALDLWHKGDLHADEEPAKRTPTKPDPAKPETPSIDPAVRKYADNIKTGIAARDAIGAALALSGQDQEFLDAVWSLLSPAEHAKLTAAWPEN